MRSSLFPLVEVDDHIITDIDGKKSTLYEIDTLDFSQMPQSEHYSFFETVERSLNSIEPNELVKFYRLDSKSFVQLQSNTSFTIPLDLKPSNEILEHFFKGVDLYSNISICDDYIVLNSHFRRILSIKSFSSESIDHSLLPENLDFVISLKKKDQVESLKKLDLVRRLHQGSFLKSRRDIESEGAYAQSEELIEDLTGQDESLFDIEIFILVDALSLEELNGRTIEVINHMKLKGIELYIEGHSLKKLKSGIASIFSSIIPGVSKFSGYRTLPDKTSHLARLLPLSTSKLMDAGIEFCDSFNDPIFFNPFSDVFKNKNMLVTGSSGGGKSVFVNKLIHSLVREHSTVILDKGGSFKKLCLYHDGVNLEQGINPMHFKDPVFLREFILSIVDKEQFKKLDRGILLKSIKEFLKRDTSNLFFNLIDYLESHFPNLSIYFEEIKGFITDGPLEERSLLYVDIENYPKNQIAPLIIYVLEYFKSINSKEKILVFDEAWEFLKDHSEYIDEKFRTVRKSGDFLIAISQGITDFKSIGELYNSIMNNSFFKVYFPQDYIDDGNTNDFDNEQIKNLTFEKGKYSECYLKTQDNRYRKILRTRLTALENELFHTEAHKSDFLYKFYDDHKKYFESSKEVIDSFVRLKNENI